MKISTLSALALLGVAMAMAGCFPANETGQPYLVQDSIGGTPDLNPIDPPTDSDTPDVNDTDMADAADGANDSEGDEDVVPDTVIGCIDGDPCDDGNPCTVDDTCNEGVCLGLPKVCPGDGSCIHGACNQDTGECDLVLANEGQPCNDGNLCSFDNQCMEGTCIGIPALCDDEDPCTNDICMPDEGCILWSDNMIIPVGAPNTAAALAFMNYVYEPEVAADIAEYVNYVSPVAGVKEILAKRDPKLAENQLIFPDDKFTADCTIQPSPEDEQAVTEAFESVLSG